jgi:hypothetical protein
MVKLLPPLIDQRLTVDPETVFSRVVQALPGAPEKYVTFCFCKKPERGWDGSREAEELSTSKFVLNRLQNP